MAKACADRIRERGGGKIINIASVAGMQHQQGMGIYGVSMAGVLMLTRTLAVDNIQANALGLGFIQTRFSRVLWETLEIHQQIIAQIPQKQLGQPEEVTGMAL